MKRENHSKTISGRRVLLIAAVCVLGLLQRVAVAQATITVGQGGGYDYATIQAGIDAATTGDTVIVHPGTYVENVVFPRWDIALRSTEPTSPAVVTATVIDGNSSGAAVAFAGVETSSCVLAGFTITNGDLGIMGNGTRATIEYNRIVNNEQTFGPPLFWRFGGGVYWCHGLIQCNTISNNATHGRDIEVCTPGQFGPPWYVHGAGLAKCHGIIQNNIITGNLADIGYGGGLYDCDGTIRNNTIVGNVARGGWGCGGSGAVFWPSYGGGLSGCGATIRNNIIWDNAASVGPQLSGSTTPTYCCIQDWPAGRGEGNIAVDPSLYGSAVGDFHLWPDSPCIDAGSSVVLSQDFEGDPRPFDGVVELRGDGSDLDIGADEFIASDTPSNLPLQPVNQSPPDRSTGVSLIPTLQASAFADFDPSDTHYVSQWQIRRTGSATDYSEPVYDSGVTNVDLTWIRIPEGILEYATEYLWRVRYADSRRTWSRWSGETEFRTRGEDPVVWFVDGDMAVSGPGTSWDRAIASISYALDAAICGDEIWVAKGTYQQALTLKSGVSLYGGFEGTEKQWHERNPVTRPTIVDGSTADAGRPVYPVVTIDGITSATFDGFTITGGGDASAYGGGIYCGSLDNTVTIANCTITGNSALRGGAIYLWEASPVLTHSTITNNTAYDGGGIYYRLSSSEIADCTISNNSAEYKGGGVHGDSTYMVKMSIEIANCTIASNSAGDTGGGLYECDGTIRNCIIWANSALGGAQLYRCDTPSHSCIQDWTGGGVGNISDNPLFTTGPLGVYYLSQTASGQARQSPCVDAGSTAAVHLGLAERTTRIDGAPDSGTVDMGYHYPLPPPDLRGTLSHISPSAIICGTPITFAGKIENRMGSACPQPVWVEFWAIGAQSGWTGYLCDSIGVPALGGHGSFDLAGVTPARTAYVNIPAGLYFIEMRIDPTGAVVETDEANNVARWGSVVILPDRPNLAVVNFDFAPQDVSPDGGTSMTFSGVVQNNGSQPTTGGFWIEFRVWHTPVPDETVADFYLCNSEAVGVTLDPGETFDLATLPARPTYALPPGVYYVRVKLDPLNQIAEQNETDNELPQTRRKLYAGPRPTRVQSWMYYH